MKLFILAYITLISVLLTGCGGGGEDVIILDSSTKDNITLLRSTPLAANTECSAGGITIDSGVDVNGNKALEDAEVTVTKVICHGESGYNSLVTVLDEPAGNNCLAGGKKISIGRDLNRNEVMDSAEVQSEQFICNGVQGQKGDADPATGGDSTAPCTVKDIGNGSKTLTCSDGSSVTIKDGVSGTSTNSACTVQDNGNGTKTLSCSDGSSVTIKDGVSPSANSLASACTVKDNGNGTKTLSCKDGSSVTINDSVANQNCSVVDNGDGTKTLGCNDGSSVTISDGTKGVDGAVCSVIDNGNGVKTLSCTDGSSVTVSDGVSSPFTASNVCTVVDNGNGVKTLSCADGSSVTISDGARGIDGTSCTVTDHGGGIATISCSDGTSVTVGG